MPPESHAVAPIPGRTTKIRRFYWRELFFREREILAELTDSASSLPFSEDDETREAAKQRALEEIKLLHQSNPKYDFREESSSELISKFSVEVVDLQATYLAKVETRKAQLLDSGESVTPEAFVLRHYERQGYSTLLVESIPFHVLFGALMCPLIEDSSDPLLRLASFGERTSFESGAPTSQISTLLPSDFGTPGYGQRRAIAIDEHLSFLLRSHDKSLLELFDSWLPRSEDLRQYLWAHRCESINIARRLLVILPRHVTLSILRYLVNDYWGRYCGWPDLLAYRDESFLFIEVKSSKDKLSEDQKRWIRDNQDVLKLPFAIVKIHRAGTQ